MSIKRFLKLLVCVFIVLVAVLIIKDKFFSFGKIDITVYNNTMTEQTIWFEPSEQFTFQIPPGEKVQVRYSTDYFTYSLEMQYYNLSGAHETVIICGYVEDGYHGKAVVKMNQSEYTEEIEFDIATEIGL